MAKHKVDLALAAQFDFQTALVEEDSDVRNERGFRALGFIGGQLDFLVLARTTSFTPSVCARQHQRSVAAMPKTFEPLTPDELKDIGSRRAEAREKARRLVETSDPDEDAKILAAALADPDAQPMTDEQLARMRPAHDVVPGIVAARIRRGRPKLEAPKQRVTMRLDADIVARLRASGRGWQTRANDALRRWLEREAP